MVKEAVRTFLSNQKEPVKFKGKWVEVVMALKSELNPDIQDEAGNTPLHYGAYRGDYRIVKLLLDGGGNLSVPNSLGLTPEGILKFKGIRVGA